MEFVTTFVIYFHTKFSMSVSSMLLLIAVRLKAKYLFRAAVIYVFVQKITVKVSYIC
jgi:hypothetical protein